MQSDDKRKKKEKKRKEKNYRNVSSQWVKNKLL